MKKLILLPLVAALAACASFGHDDTQRAVRIDPAQLDLSRAQAQWPVEQWWRGYGDSQLDTLVDEAIAGSPSIVTARARLARAQSAAGMARADTFPQINGRAGATWEHLTENYIYPPPLGGSNQVDSSLALDASYDLDFWGKNRSLLAAAVSDANAAQAENQAAVSLLASSVASSYFDLQRLFAQHGVLEQAIKQRAAVHQLTQQRYTSGLDTQVEVKQAESALAEARTQLAQVEEAISLRRNELAALVGKGPERGQSIQAAPLAKAVIALPSSVPLSLLGRRADVVAARWRAEAQFSRIDAAKAMFYPDVNLAAFIGVQALGLNKLLQSDSLQYGGGPAITLPIFGGGRLRANLRGRKADADEAVAAYNQAVLHAVHEVADTLDSIRSLERQQVEQRHAREAIEQAYDLALKRYRAGLGNYLSVLTAQSAVLTQERQDTDLQARALTLDVSLAKALGGGVQQLPAAPVEPVASR